MCFLTFTNYAFRKWHITGLLHLNLQTFITCICDSHVNFRLKITNITYKKFEYNLIIFFRAFVLKVGEMTFQEYMLYLYIHLIKYEVWNLTLIRLKLFMSCCGSFSCCFSELVAFFAARLFQARTRYFTERHHANHTWYYLKFLFNWSMITS